MLDDLQGSLTVETSDHGFFEGWSWGERLFARLETRLNRAPDEVVASAAPMLAGIREDRGRHRDGVWFLGDGVDVSAFRADPDRRRSMREQLGYRDDERVIAYLGLLTPYQGLDVLCRSAVRVARTVPEARFLVMGFPNEDRYRTRAAELGIADRMQFTGRIRYEDAPAHLAAADLAVSAKLSTTEANGKLLNYMAVGLPTVAFETQVNREILGDLGVYARLGDEEDLADRLIDLLRDASCRQTLSERLRRRAVECHSWEARGRQFTEIYQRLADRHAGEARLQEP